MIRRIFVANRGEIALRIIRTARAHGLETVLGASRADMESLPAKLATRTVCIGPAPASASYLRADLVVQAALGTGCDALHPGYGFLSENRDLAQACAQAGITFIGPSVENLAAVGDKLTARAHAVAAGVPLVPGGTAQTLAQAQDLAQKIGFPILIKAVAGGGGKGMKRVDTAADLPAALNLAISEAEAAFGDGRVYLERYVTTGRHVEVQIIADGTRVLHAGTRDCSVQRRYQKLIEEAPAPHLPDTLRAGLESAAIAFAQHIGYRSIGTVEFLVDLPRGAFYFLEMNARIQVEHPVTEAVTGLDLVALQIAIAEGRALALTQDQITPRGHAIECRLNAEDVTADFRPAPGTVSLAYFPAMDGLRVDSHIHTGAVVPPFYDNLLAKFIAYGETRAAALAVMQAALAAMALNGVASNAALHRAIISDPDFGVGGVDTNYLTDLLPRLTTGMP